MRPAATSPGSVLLVDDNADIRFLARRVLENAGLEVAEASGGIAALELLEGGTSPDLIVLDVQMPGMSGWDVLRQIRLMEEQGWEHMPVVMCTVKTSPDSRQLGDELGCDGYLGKPFRVAELRSMVEKMLAPPPHREMAGR